MDLTQQQTPVPPDSRTTAPSKQEHWYQRWQTWAAVAVAVALLVAAGLLGASSVDPTASDQYRQIAAERDDSRAEVASLEEQVDRLGDQASNARADASTAQVSVAARDAELDAQEAQLAARESAVAASEATIAANTIGAGTYVVGVDMQPGTWRTQNAVSSDCYWKISVSGTNGSDIVENDFPGGGFPTVTLSEGQDFNSARCGEWTLQ